MVSLPTQIGVTRPQWVKSSYRFENCIVSSCTDTSVKLWNERITKATHEAIKRQLIDVIIEVYLWPNICSNIRELLFIIYFAYVKLNGEENYDLLFYLFKDMCSC